MSEKQDWFVFRGERDYLHSTSLFDFILAENAGNAGVPQNVDFTFIRKSRHICRIEKRNLGNAGLVATYVDEGSQYYLYETDEPIQRSVPYAEPAEGSNYAISGDCASVQKPGEDNSFIELAVGAYKGLLTSLFPEHRGNYVFARIRLDMIPVSSFEICYRRKVARHFFEGEIKAEGLSVGFIYFGV